MKTPLQYAQRLQEKREVFNPDGETLDIVKLNRYVNGVPGRTKPVPDDRYLHTSTSLGHRCISNSRRPERVRLDTASFLKATLIRDFAMGQHGQELKDMADAVALRAFMDGGVLVTPWLRARLQALADAYTDWLEASYAMPVPELDSEDQPERPWAASEAALEQWVDELEPVSAGGGPDLWEIVTYERLARQEEMVRAGPADASRPTAFAVG